MSNKGFKKILAVSLLSVMGLVACSNDIQAKPQDYDEPLITFSDSNDEVYHNLVRIIQDAYRDGSLASAVLDKVLYQYSVSVFGRYNRVAKPTNLGENEITLKEAVKELVITDGVVTGLKTSHEKVDRFINEHKAYWTTNNDGERVPAEERGLTEYARVYSKWIAIETRISRAFHSAISGGAYNDERSYFSEKDYLKELRYQLHEVKNPYDSGTKMTVKEDKVVITSEVEEEEVFTKLVKTASGTTTLLHRENYQDPKSNDLTQVENADTDIKYVEEEIIPTIYRALLVEQYLLDESYNNLGRSAARKINVIAIDSNSNNDKAADYLMKYFVREKINKKGANITIADFNAVSDAYKGIVNSEGKVAYLDAVNDHASFKGAFPKVTFKGYNDVSYTYYVGTEYGDMMESFSKIKKDINTTDSSAESDFTGSYTYSPLVGLEIKTNNILKNDYTADGWYIKSTGVSELPDSMKSRLFNISVANVLDNSSIVDRFAGEGADPVVPNNENKFVAKINGKYYLKVDSKQAGADPKDDILFYEGGKYYVVQIEEAVSGSKLAKESDVEYYPSASYKENIINEVARVVADNDSYKSASTKHWLEEAAIKYHDTKVYDYFKENYPDLFD